MLLNQPSIRLPITSEIEKLPAKIFENFFEFTSKPIIQLKPILRNEQQYNENFAYAYNSLRAFPMVRMSCLGIDSLVCPIPTLLFWRITSGLYYELISVAEFANEFGDGFQTYVGEVIERACPPPMQQFPEAEYMVGKAKKKTVDWIVADDGSALFLECKAKRLTWGAKSSLLDLEALECDLENLGAAVVQVYKTIMDYLCGAYINFDFCESTRIFPVVVTLENWRFFGPVMTKKLADVIDCQIKKAGIPSDLVAGMPYSIWAIEDLEVGLQIMAAKGIAGFMDGKLGSAEMNEWDWHGYMTHNYRSSFPAKALFSEDYEAIFSGLE